MRGNPRPLHGYLVRRRLECIKKSRHPNLRSWSFRRVAEWRLLSWITVRNQIPALEVEINQTTSWLHRIMQTTGWWDQSPTLEAVSSHVINSTSISAKCQLAYMIEASWVMWSCAQWDSSVSVWFNQTVLGWGYLQSTSLLQNVRFLSTHPFNAWEVSHAALKKWCVFQLHQPKMNLKDIGYDRLKSDRILSSGLSMEPHLRIPRFVVVHGLQYFPVSKCRTVADRCWFAGWTIFLFVVGWQDRPGSLYYSLIGDFFMIWRQIKDFKSDIVFSACFDYDIDTYYI